MLKLIITASISSAFFGLFGIDWESVDRKIDREYPTIEFVSTDQLLSQYRDSSNELPIIIDVREADEFLISHLRTARNIETGDRVAELFVDKESPIIVYCSTGYRSAGVAARLEELGYSNVQNLRHSIFEWASRDYPLESSSGDTDKIHPFNRAWGSLVDKSLHQYSP
jgi:rhodanese-related sulfurtransferase